MQMELVQLFFISFLAGSILPFPSEAFLLFLQNKNLFSDFTILLTATAGNTIGAIINYYLGKGGSLFILKKFYRMERVELERAALRFTKYGHFAAFFSFIPFIGDPLTVAAGAIGYPVLRFIPLVFSGKLIRYMLILGIFRNITG
ncbi:MAG: VTT domain-containing protein [Leptospira sp.]|nr:VTT domain-containing protein [Leptospira sp.]